MSVPRILRPVAPILRFTRLQLEPHTWARYEILYTTPRTLQYGGPQFLKLWWCRYGQPAWTLYYAHDVTDSGIGEMMTDDDAAYAEGFIEDAGFYYASATWGGVNAGIESRFSDVQFLPEVVPV